MNDEPHPSASHPKRSLWPLWLVLVVLAAALGPGRAWRAYRTGPERCFHAGLAAFAANDLDGVQSTLEGLRGREGYAPHGHLLQGMLLLRNGRLIEAIEEFGFARGHPQTAAQAHLLSGEALYGGKDFQSAQRVLARACELDPTLTDARRWLGALYYDIGAMALAREQLLKVAEEAPDDPRPLRLLALINKDFELYTEAIRDYRESLRRGPDQPGKEEVQRELAECLFKAGQFDQSLAVLTACQRSADTLALEAECRYATGEAAAARRLVEETLHLAPDHLEALLLAATLQIEAGELETALQTLDRAKTQHAKEPRVYHKLAQVCRRLQRNDEALQHAQIGRRLREQLTRFADLHRIAIREPANVKVRYELGLAADGLGKRDLARSWFAAALAMNPNYTEARAALQALDAQTSPGPAETQKRG
jgi:tetratricopeptide (TPR) repeat protein